MRKVAIEAYTLKELRERAKDKVPDHINAYHRARHCIRFEYVCDAQVQKQAVSVSVPMLHEEGFDVESIVISIGVFPQLSKVAIRMKTLKAFDIRPVLLTNCLIPFPLLPLPHILISVNNKGVIQFHNSAAIEHRELLSKSIIDAFKKCVAPTHLFLKSKAAAKPKEIDAFIARLAHTPYFTTEGELLTDSMSQSLPVLWLI